MKIIFKKEIINMPNGTVYSEINPYGVYGLRVKLDNLIMGNEVYDFRYYEIYPGFQLQMFHIIQYIDKSNFNPILYDDMPQAEEGSERDGLYDFSDNTLYTIYSNNEWKEILEFYLDLLA